MRSRFGALLVVGLAASLFAVGCGGDDTDATAECEEDDVVVTVRDNVFEPQEVEIAAGATICWPNEGRIAHNVVPDEGDLFGIGTFSPGEAYRFTFEEPGEYPYYCSFHGAPGRGQWGSVTVTS